jgi:general secretion pathway protein G
MSRGSEGAADSALRANLAVLRNAIDLYKAEHQGTLPTLAKFSEQLTTYTDINGTDNASKTGVYYFGPYLRSIPSQPVGPRKGSTGVGSADAAGVGWIYDATTGDIRANADANDVTGKNYNTY